MIEERLPDCRRRRHDDAFTSARSHPELLTGEFAMRPQIKLSSQDRKAARLWAASMLAAVAVLVVAVLTLPAFRGAHAPTDALAQYQAGGLGLGVQAP
jgi:hypothetical protein